MAVTNADLEGFEAEVETVPAKSSGVKVSTIPEALVKLLEEKVPDVLDNLTKEIILRVPSKPDYSQVPPLGKNFTKEEEAVALKATVAADAVAEKIAAGIVRQLCLYATAWGKGQEPKLYIRKIMNRRDMPTGHARLQVQTWDKVPEANRQGRRFD